MYGDYVSYYYIYIYFRYPDINYLIETLRERRVIRAKVKQGTVPLYGEMNQALKAVSLIIKYF